MTIKSSGPISIGDINVELGLVRAGNKNLGNADVRTLLQKPSGAVPLSAAYGKSKALNGGDFYPVYQGGGVLPSVEYTVGFYGTSNPYPLKVLQNTVTVGSIGLMFGYLMVVFTSYLGSSVTVVIDGNTVTLPYDPNSDTSSGHWQYGVAVGFDILPDKWHTFKLL